MIVAVPAFTPFTTPVLLTVATFVLLLVNVAFASLSLLVAFRFTVFPVYKAAVFLFRAAVTLTSSFSAA